MPVENYGLKWNYDDGMVGKLAGGDHVKFYEQIGIYVIYWGDQIVYVGRSGSGNNPGIYGRLKGHKEDGWKFSTYSWFGMYPVGAECRVDRSAPTMSVPQTVKNLEALLI